MSHVFVVDFDLKLLHLHLTRLCLIPFRWPELLLDCFTDTLSALFDSHFQILAKSTNALFDVCCWQDWSAAFFIVPVSIPLSPFLLRSTVLLKLFIATAQGWVAARRHAVEYQGAEEDSGCNNENINKYFATIWYGRPLGNNTFLWWLYFHQRWYYNS